MLQDTLKILSDTNRLRILNLLNEKALCVCELEYLLEINQSNLSRHLSKMNKQGVLDSWRENKYSFYKINDKFRESYDFVEKIINLLKEEEPFRADWANYEAYQGSEITCACLPDMLLEMKSQKIQERRQRNE